MKKYLNLFLIFVSLAVTFCGGTTYYLGYKTLKQPNCNYIDIAATNCRINTGASILGINIETDNLKSNLTQIKLLKKIISFDTPGEDLPLPNSLINHTLIPNNKYKFFIAENQSKSLLLENEIYTRAP